MERAYEMCLERVSQKKRYSTDINMLKRKTANEFYQMLPYYEGKYEPRRNRIAFESAKVILLTAETPMFEKRRIERIKDMKTCKSHMKSQDVPENKELLIYGFKHFKQIKSISIY